AKPYGKQRGEEQRKTDGGAKPYGKQRGEEQRKTDGGAKPYGKQRRPGSGTSGQSK
ncbi:MAG: hypothetical protein HFI35_03735, partial [Roseburia sp.]|nr:hypothetical protein [Roseburia sp.]